MIGVGEGEEQAHGYGTNPCVHQLSDTGPGLFRVQGKDLLSPGIHSLPYRPDQMPGHELPRTVEEQVVHLIAAPLPVQLQDVAEPLGDQEPGGRLATLQQRIQPDGGAVEYVTGLFRKPGGDLPKTGGDGLCGIPGLGGDLVCQADPSVVLVEHAQVGERAAGVNADAQHVC